MVRICEVWIGGPGNRAADVFFDATLVAYGGREAVRGAPLGPLRSALYGRHVHGMPPLRAGVDKAAAREE